MNFGPPDPCPEKVEALAAGIAKRGESWESARERAKWLLNAVHLCAPCDYCDPEDLAINKRPQGWSDDAESYDQCLTCRSSWDLIVEPPEPRRVAAAKPPLGPGDRPCRGCGAPAVPYGKFCPRCYGAWLHPDGLPMEPGDPDDPYREFNAEADAYMLDQKMPWFLEAQNSVPRPVQKPAVEYIEPAVRQEMKLLCECGKGDAIWLMSKE